MAYAHSRGVIHRDVKPDNVMLGTYGETILLDWGLAKLRGQVDSRHGDGADGGGGGGDQSGVTSRPGIPSVPHPPAALSGHSARTEDGSILGSPLYMPPEMAHGHVVDADQRTDVYLLGATLYEILAGRPPRQGASRDEILEMARTAPLVPPRHFQSDTPRALQAICLKAMATDKSRRYESAMQLADDVQRFLAGEVVSAYREPLAARAWRWARRRRVALARCASAGVLVACAAAGLLVYRDAERVKAREIARDQVERFRHLADEAHYYGAGSNAPGEIAPYYDTTRARDAARAALALTDQWGVTLQHLPLTSQRPDIRRELAELCQRLAQLQLAGGVGGGGRQDAATTSSQVFALLDR